MPRALALACALAALLSGDAHAAQALRVVVVPALDGSDLRRLSRSGAVGLLVPDAGPTTSERRALAALQRGAVRNSLRGGLPEGPALIPVERSESVGVVAPAILVALPRGGEQPNDRRYPIAVVAPGYRGLLTSNSTRIPGLVSIADVAPTALARKGALGSEPVGDAVGELRDLDVRIDDNNAARLPAFLLWAVLTAALAIVRPRAAVLAFATVAIANLLLGAAGLSGFSIVLPAVAVATLAAVPLARALRPPVAVGAVMASTLAAYLVAFAVDQSWLALSPLGPTQNSRFYGLSNLLETILLIPALVAAALLGRSGFVAVAALALVTVAGSRFGADGGGALVLAAAFAVLGVGLAGAGRRTLAAALGGSVVAVLVLVALDALTGASSHVTRSLSGGPAGVASDLGDRMALSVERATAHWYTALIVAGTIAALAVLVARTLPRARERTRRALLAAFAAAIAVSLIVNDSPVDVALAGLTGYLALARSPVDAATRASSPRYSGPRSA